jgi:hypothetical protein
MITLKAIEFHWVEGIDDDALDQCAHGRVCFEIDDVIFVRPEDGVWTVSGAGLFLLRTIQHEHTANHSVAEHNFLFPCCAHSCWAVGEGEFKLICMGCNSGIDLEVKHFGTSVEIGVRDGKRAIVQAPVWQAAVFQFADQVRAFYDQSAAKAVPDDVPDKEGWAAFWNEWYSRRFGPNSRAS